MFNIGDMIIVAESSNYYYEVKDLIGEVILFDDLGHWENQMMYAGVDFGDKFNGHNLNGRMEKSTCYWIESKCLEHYKNTNRGVYSHGF